MPPPKNRLDLLVPALFWPDAAAAGSVGGFDTPDLDTLFARGSRQAEAGPGVEHWLARRFALDLDGELPLAALSLTGEGGDPGGRVWMRADPVHLHARGTELFLTRGADLDILPDEARTITEALNDLFADENLRFEARRPSEWYLSLDRMPSLRTTPLGLAHGRSIGPLLPTGEDAGSWQKRLSEAQMLLHGLPVNEVREHRGAPPVNGLWLWGIGKAPATIAHAYDSVFGNDTMTRGLGVASGAQVRPLPAGFSGIAPSGSLLVRLQDAENAAARGAVGDWQRAIAAISENWVRPALAALRTRQLDQIELTGFAGRTGATVTATRRELRRFWRRRAPYSALRPEP